MKDGEFERMKDEARSRMSKMYSEAHPETEEEPAAEPPRKGGGLLEALLEDKERAMLLALIILLMDEKGSMDLILALIYLI